MTSLGVSVTRLITSTVAAHAMIAICVSANIASTSVGKPVSRRMVLPFVYTFLHGSFDSGGTGARAQLMKSPPAWPSMGNGPGTSKKSPKGAAEHSSNEKPIVFRDSADTPLSLPDTNSPWRKQLAGKTNEEGIEQRMLLPEGYSIPEELYGSNYVWDTKGWPRLVETTPGAVANVTSFGKNKLHNDSAIIFQDPPHVSRHFLNASPQNNFLEKNPDSRCETDGLEQRMLLPEGQKIPKMMFGPNYVWDTKGWPRFVGEVPQATQRQAKPSVKSGSEESR